MAYTEAQKKASMKYLAEKTDESVAESVQPDEWDLKMIAEAAVVNDGSTVSIENLASDLGVAL